MPDDIWLEVERSAPDNVSGIIRRRIFPEAACNLFLAVRKPANQRMLVLSLGDISGVAGIDLPVGRGIETSLAPAGQSADEPALQVVLLDHEFASVFSVLVTDVASAVARASSEAEGSGLFVQRLKIWQRLLERQGGAELATGAQQGLYGELWFLRELLIVSAEPGLAVRAWTGPGGAAQDFQLRGRAVEVKTSGTKLPQRLTINNERQLDLLGLHSLFLVQLSLDVREGSGESLPEIVSSVRATVNADQDVSMLFEDRLLEAGYVDVQSARYSRTGYTVRERRYYHVTDGFPRIVAADLRPGVGDVRYSVGVSDCIPFAISDADLWLALREE